MSQGGPPRCPNRNCAGSLKPPVCTAPSWETFAPAPVRLLDVSGRCWSTRCGPITSTAERFGLPPDASWDGRRSRAHSLMSRGPEPVSGSRARVVAMAWGYACAAPQPERGWAQRGSKSSPHTSPVCWPVPVARIRAVRDLRTRRLCVPCLGVRRLGAPGLPLDGARDRQTPRWRSRCTTGRRRRCGLCCPRRTCRSLRRFEPWRRPPWRHSRRSWALTRRRSSRFSSIPPSRPTLVRRDSRGGRPPAPRVRVSISFRSVS